MAISRVIERLGKAIFEAPFGAGRLSKDAPELAEVRIAVLDAVKAKSHRANGKQVFPYDLVRIHLLGIPEEQAGIFRGEFLREFFAQEIKAGLLRSSYRFPAALSVEIVTSPSLPSADQEWITVTVQSTAANVQPTEPSHGVARLIVKQGTADQQEITLEKKRTNLGRTPEVFRGSGPSRRNDLAFAEDNDISRSVSREHAHVLRTGGEYRIFNDRTYKGAENCGVWIVRDGLSFPVQRSARGTALKPGDEIHLGTAVLEFQVG